MENIYAPETKNERPEDGCANHYHFRRAYDEAYWAAILFAYDNHKRRGLGILGANRMAWEEFFNEVMPQDFGGIC